MEKLLPRKGAIAVCRKGEIGLIESDKPNKNGVWFGKNLLKDMSWQSKHPVVLSVVLCHEDAQNAFC